MERRRLAVFAVALLAVLGGCAGLEIGASESPGDGTPPTLGPDPANWTLEPGAGTNATVVDVVDGDTVDVRYENGTTDTIRLLGVDSPEVRGNNDPAEFEGVPDTGSGEDCLRAAGDDATAFVSERIADREVRIVVDPTADRRDRYGRLLAYVHVDGVDLNYRLVLSGNARVYDSTFARSERYYAAESDAQSARRALWECRSPGSGDPGTGTDGSETDDEPVATSTAGLVVARVHADASGNDHENLNDEYVVFRNDGEETLELGGWTVSDEAGYTFAFPDGFTLGPGETATLRTGAGEDTGETLYWGRDGAVWNNGGDTVRVTADGETILEYQYE